MAISDRITSIEEHIKESYQELEGIGIDTTGVDKNLENIPKLIDGYWETLPKVTGEGTSITLDNTKEGKMKINLKGNTSQAGTPTPETPQDIHVVSGDNSINVVGKNLFKPSFQNNGTNIILNNISTYSISNGEFSFTASGTDMYFGNVKNAGSEYSDERGIKIFRYDNDYISFNLSNTSLNRTYITAYDSNNISLGFTNINSYRGTYQFPSGCDYITIRFGKADATSGTTYKTTIMVAYGNTIPTYEPYQGNTYPINLPVENLLPNNGITETNNGITFTKNADNTITLNGTATADTYINVWYDTSNNLINDTNQVYTMSIGLSNSNVGLAIFEYVNNSWVNKKYVYAKSTTYTPSGNQTGQIFRVIVKNGATLNNVIVKPMLEVGTKVNTYVPYGTTPIELCKIETNQDHIFKAINGDSVYDNLSSSIKETLTYGKWYIEKQIYKHTYKGGADETWYAIPGLDNTTKFFTITPAERTSIPATQQTTGEMCDRFTQNNPYSQIGNYFWAYDNGTVSSLRIGFDNQTITTANDFKTWLSNNPTTVLYPLLTPTYTEITNSTLISQLNALAKSYASQTNISQDNNDESSIINATALEDV